MKLHSLILAGIFLAFLQTPFLSANDVLPAPAPSGPLLLHGGSIHPVSRPSISQGKLLIRDGLIVGVASSSEVLPGEEEASPIDCTGLHLYPGLISANGSLGLIEISAVRATRDLSEPGPINPSLRAEIAVNPDSELIPVTRANGVLTTLTVPQGGLIGGRSALLQLDGWTWEDMVLRAPVGMHLSWPAMRHSSSANEKARTAQREHWDESLQSLLTFFDDARAYQKAKRRGGEPFRTDVRLEAMLPVLDRRLPLFIHALGLTAIQSALQFVEAQDVKAVLVSGQDVGRVAPLLRERQIPVILSTVQALPLRRWEPHDTAKQVPATLLAAGVPFCIANGDGAEGSSNARNLPYSAASAVGQDFSADDALRSITLSAAEILGVADQLGSLDSGKQATLIVTDGHPLEITTQVKRAFIHGRELDLTSKHTRLYEKYREKRRRQQTDDQTAPSP